MAGRKKALIIIIITIAAAVIIAAAIVMAWHKGAFLPGWIEWKQSSRQYEVSQTAGSASIAERIDLTLKNRKLTVSAEEGSSLWESGDGILVQDFLFEDIDHDGERELMLLCWKIGKYGEAIPKFGEGEDHKWHQHIYIYDWENDTMNATWMASEIGLDVTEWSFSEEERLILTDADGNITHWDWIDWGLELASE